MGSTFVDETIGDFVYVKVSPMKGVNRFGRVSKLSPRYVGPFEIIERDGNSAYRLLLPNQMSDIHNMFHENLQYKEEPEKILAYYVRKLRSKQIPMFKVQWKFRTTREATWEKESDMRQLYP
ncbi:uncharacterized protein LOC110113821, partial [Dendrobium catenatum]|uniref:uncharacterized protein LOC110113821 n=1 Tax=Dendrobium catenatum TaxID=906689 RepID=UPI0010A06D00